MTHRTEEELSEGEEEAVANEIQPGHRTFSSGTRFLLQLYYEDPFPMSLAPATSCLLSWPLLSLPKSTWYPILPNLYFPSTGTAPALLSLQPLCPLVILEADSSYPAMLYLSTNSVLEKYKSVPPGIGFCCNQPLPPKESEENRTGQTGWTLEYNYTAEAIHK